MPRVTYTSPQAGAVGATEAPYSGTTVLSEVPKTATYTHDYAQSTGFLTLLSDTIQPFPSFSGIYDGALTELRMRIQDRPPPIRPVAAQAAGRQP